jgi:hypothetical protein
MLCATKSACYEVRKKTPEIAPPGIFLRDPHHQPVLATILSAIARFPAATAVPSRLSFILERQESLPEERPRGIPVYIKDAGTRTFSRRRWFGLGSPIVPVV